MKLLILDTNDPYYNLAVEEYIFENAQEETFILWQNKPCVVIGKNQNVFAEINLDFTKEQNIKIVRRITGGGAVYHDLGNLNFSYISPTHCGGIDFAKYTHPILCALKSMSLDAELSGRNDILIDGKKVSGNAQFSKNGRVLHHGTILFNSDLSVLSSALHVDPEKIKSKAIKSVKSRVANIKELLCTDLSVIEFRDIIAKHIEKEFDADRIDAPSSLEIDKIYERNASSDWIFPNRELLSKYTLNFKKRFDFGSIEFCFSMRNELVESLRIYGDFFEINPVFGLEESFSGKTISEIKIGYKNFKIENYIHGMDSEDLNILLQNEVLPANNI